MPNRNSRKTILLVEDDDNVRVMIQELLSTHDYLLLTASSPIQALGMIKHHSGIIDLLITDIIMPGINGKQLSDELRKQYPELQTIFISGYSNTFFNKSFQLPPKSHFTQKPFSLNDFMLLVRQLLEA